VSFFFAGASSRYIVHTSSHSLESKGIERREDERGRGGRWRVNAARTPDVSLRLLEIIVKLRYLNF
jgi:hypothetical protein